MGRSFRGIGLDEAIIAIVLISAGMILVVRSAMINTFLGGLDKSYRLHKWFGIAGFVTSTIHWALVNFPKWFFEWEAMVLPPPQASPILESFRSQYALAVKSSKSGWLVASV